MHVFFSQADIPYPSRHAILTYFTAGALPPLGIHIHWAEVSMETEFLPQVGQHMEAAIYFTEGDKGSHIPFYSTESGCFVTEFWLLVGDPDLLLELTSHFIPLY